MAALIAMKAGGIISPIFFLVAGASLLLWPNILRSSVANRVVPVKESILLRDKIFPLRWHALAEVKLEAQDQLRGIAALGGRLLVLSGSTPMSFLVVTAYSIGYKGAEAKVVRELQRETTMLSQRGVHLLPLDSRDAATRLSVKLESLAVGTKDFDALSSFPFDVLALQVKEGMVSRHRAFRIEGPSKPAHMPRPDITPGREPLFAELVEVIAKKHAWPGPDEFSPFLAALHVRRREPVGDRIRTRDEGDGTLEAETTGGSRVRLSRAQLRAVARVYA